MRILFVTQYGAMAASSRTRVFNYLPFLRDHGVEDRVITVLPDRAIAGSFVDVRRHPLRKLRYYLWALWRTASCGARAWWLGRRSDLVFIQKVIFPAPVRWLLRSLHAPIVYDFDDAIFTTEVRSGHWLARLKEARNASGLPAMLQLCELAVVENEYTVDFARRYCDTLTITGPIDTGPFEGAAEVQARQDSAPVVLGWIGSESTAAYLDLIRPVLQRLAADHEIRVRVIGAHFTCEGVDVECLPWSLAGEADDLAGCDIGLMPVPDDPWTRGKGGYKLLQYMACGLPVVAHPVGVNTQIVEDGVSGYLAADEPGWHRALVQLVTDPALRQRFGRAGRERIGRDYSLASQQPRLLQALQGLAERAA